MNKCKLILVLTAFNFAIVSSLYELNAAEKKTLETKFPAYYAIMKEFFTHLSDNKPNGNLLTKDFKSLQELKSESECESLKVERINRDDYLKDHVREAIKGSKSSMDEIKEQLAAYGLKLIDGMCDKIAPLTDDQIADLNNKYPKFLKSVYDDIRDCFSEGVQEEDLKKAMKALDAEYECEALKTERFALNNWIRKKIPVVVEAYNIPIYPEYEVHMYELKIGVHTYGLKLLNGECNNKPVIEKNPKPTLC